MWTRRSFYGRQDIRVGNCYLGVLIWMISWRIGAIVFEGSSERASEAGGARGLGRGKEKRGMREGDGQKPF